MIFWGSFRAQSSWASSVCWDCNEIGSSYGDFPSFLYTCIKKYIFWTLNSAKQSYRSFNPKVYIKWVCTPKYKKNGGDGEEVKKVVVVVFVGLLWMCIKIKGRRCSLSFSSSPSSVMMLLNVQSKLRSHLQNKRWWWLVYYQL